MDFEAKAREVCRALPAWTPSEAAALVADALRAAALDEGAREAARAELAGLLAEVKARAEHPPYTVSWDEPPIPTTDLTTAVPWDAPTEATPPADIEAVHEAISAHVLNPAVTLARLLERLLWLLGLSEGERRFVTALADDAADFDTAQVYADWLLDQGRTANGARVRRLVPRDGDVLVWTVSGGEDPVRLAEVRRHAQALCDGLRDRGLHTLGAVVPQGVEVDSLGVGAMRAAGWVRAADVRRALRDVADDAVTVPGGVDAAVQTALDLFPLSGDPP
jgi:hypothetical protein